MAVARRLPESGVLRGDDGEGNLKAEQLKENLYGKVETDQGLMGLTVQIGEGIMSWPSRVIRGPALEAALDWEVEDLLHDLANAVAAFMDKDFKPNPAEVTDLPPPKSGKRNVPAGKRTN